MFSNLPHCQACSCPINSLPEQAPNQPSFCAKCLPVNMNRNNLSAYPQGTSQFSKKERNSYQTLFCEVCCEAYDKDQVQPIVLPCGHTFCLTCLKSFRNKCPTCREHFGTSQVKKNYILYGLLDEKKKRAALMKGREDERCLVHKRERDRFCKSCRKLMCSVCHCEHIGSETIISDENLRDEVKELEKALKEAKAEERALREKINEGFKAKVKELEEEEASSKKEMRRILDKEILEAYRESELLIYKAKEEAEEKIKLIEEEKQKCIQEVKNQVQIKIEAIQAKQNGSLDNISSKRLESLGRVEAKNQLLLGKIEVSKYLNEFTAETLSECALLYQLWEEKKPYFTEILMLNKNSAESLFAQNSEDQLFKKNAEISNSEEDDEISFWEGFKNSDREDSNREKKDCKRNEEDQNQGDNLLGGQNKQQKKFQSGESIDCCDTVGKWLNARVIDMNESQIKVHYNGWSDKFDEWIDMNSNRVLKQWKKGDEFQINHRIDAKDTVNKWLVARVISIREYVILIHYEGWSEKYDEWVPKYSNRIAEVGYYSK